MLDNYKILLHLIEHPVSTNTLTSVGVSYFATQKHITFNAATSGIPTALHVLYVDSPFKCSSKILRVTFANFLGSFHVLSSTLPTSNYKS